MPKLLNRRYITSPLPKTSVYIGRPSKWGNPFTIGKDGTREEVIRKYDEWLHQPQQKHLLDDIHQLIGRDLVCWCAPLACHGQVLLDELNKLYSKRKK